MDEFALGTLRAGRDLFLLTSRLLAAEIDIPFYRSLLHLDDDGRAGPRMIDEDIRALPEKRAIEELAAEFCRLFVGPRPACPPYESVQRGEATIGGRAERRMRRYMERHGLATVLPTGFPVLADDHLSVQLVVMHRLFERAPTQSGTGTSRSPDPVQEFLDDHLLPWAPAYLRELQATSVLGPYRTIAALTAQLLTAVPAMPAAITRP